VPVRDFPSVRVLCSPRMMRMGWRRGGSEWLDWRSTEACDTATHVVVADMRGVEEEKRGLWEVMSGWRWGWEASCCHVLDGRGEDAAGVRASKV
jgi:hypothetical protein